MSNTLPPNRTQVWFQPGRYVPVEHVRGIEVLPPASRHRGGVRVDRTTIHGTPSALLELAAQLIRAAALTERRTAR